MSGEDPNPHQDDGSGGLGDRPNVCRECGNYDEFEEDQGKWACLACGMHQKGSFPERDPDPDNIDIKFLNPDEDPKWQKSTYVFVPAQKKRPNRLSKTVKKVKSAPVGRELSSPLRYEERDFSIESEYVRQATAYLGMNPRASVPNRSQWYEPFYEAPFDAFDMTELQKSDTRLPGPVFQLLNAGHLPPRRYWILPFDPEEKPIRTADWIRPDFRIPFEMYLHLNRKLQRPWPLAKWVKQLNIRNKIGEILTKGGALSRKCEPWLGEPQIGEMEIQNYLDNLDITNEFSTPNFDLYVSEAMRILNAMEQKGFMTAFLDKLCTLVQPNGEPSEFWIFGPDFNRKDIGHIHSISILVGLVVHAAIKSLGRENPGALLNIAVADEEFTNGNQIESRWGAIMANLDLE